ncbi:MAG: hypothetical protein HZB31_12555 [Nitrospirae bacterium]|nr:hypothetical protein [Nitrospirota bacterium]
MEKTESISHLESIADVVIPLAFIVLLILGFYFIVFGSEKVVKKDTIKRDMQHVIMQNGDLKAVKQLYANREIERYTILDRLSGRSSYYDSDVPLSVILEDLRLGLFETRPAWKDSPKDFNILLERVDSIIKEYIQTNPFDSLEDIQKDYFENIRLKLSAQYPLVQTEVNKIADELRNKNILVARYLKDSTRSYWISIIAFAVSTLIAFIQFWQTNKYRRQIANKSIEADRG